MLPQHKNNLKQFNRSSPELTDTFIFFIFDIRIHYTHTVQLTLEVATRSAL